MEAEIHKALCHVGGVNAVFRFEMTQVDDAFVRHAAAEAVIQRAELGLQRSRHIVGVEDGHLAGLLEAVGAQHLDVGVGDDQQQRAAVRGAAHRTHTAAAALRHHRMAGEIGCQGFCAADGTYTRTAAAVRHCEGLVQV